jgi:HSP20 family protein
MEALNEFKRGLGQAWDSVTDGWRDLRHRASGAVTHFRPRDELPAANEDLMPTSWALLATDVYDTDDTLVVRLEAPGMSKGDFTVEVRDNVLHVAGEKRFERESGKGHYRVMQCAYGQFERSVPLPVPVKGDQARATYRDGVLRIELPKAEKARARRVAVKAA